MCAGGLATVAVGYFQDDTGYGALAYALMIGSGGALLSLLLAIRAAAEARAATQGATANE
jgi:hypothetical protein